MSDYEKSRFYEAMLIDQNSKKVGVHIDPKMQERIGRGEFVNLQRLLPKRKLNIDPDERSLQMTNNSGTIGLSESTDSIKDCLPINCLSRWEDGFRVYMGIYVRFNPNKCDEMIQYMENIKNAARIYPWELVYNYDQRFRETVHSNPTRTWAVLSYDDFYKEILAPVGMLALQSAGGQSSGSFPGTQTNHGNGRAKNKKRACWTYNRTGSCKYGDSCKFDHRCIFCNKLGHPECKCRAKKAKAGSPKEDK